MLARSRSGHELLNFIPGTTPTRPDDSIPLRFTQIVAMLPGGVLLIYNRDRQQWEVPGGGLEPDESPDACAVRELREETAQTADQIAFKALFTIRLHPSGLLEYGALYTARLAALTPFVPNDEVERLTVWDGCALLDGEISAFTRVFVTYCQP